MMVKQRRVTKAYFLLALSQYMPLIQKLAFQMRVNDTQIEELKARAIEELLKCMICYNRSGSFMTFFHGRLANVFRHMRGVEAKVRRIHSMPIEAMVPLVGLDYCLESNLTAEEALTHLDDEERLVIMDIFFDEKTMREIATDRGMILSTICRIKNKAIDKIKRKFEIG